MLRLAGADGRVSVRLIVKKSGSGWEWVAEKSGVEADEVRSFDPAGSLRTNNLARLDGNSLDISNGTVENDGNTRLVIPWMFAVADPCEKWWERMRGNPKRAGEISQAAFLLKVEMMGFHLALPWGDSERYDFVVWGRDGTTVRVQVKGTGRLHRNGYEVQPVHTTRKGGKKRYTKKDIDVIAAHVQPVDAWYLIPIEKVGRAKSLRLHPETRSRSGAIDPERPNRRKLRRGQPSWERWLDAWEVLGQM
jgi:PD-(D/E)XK endonuclease